MIKKILSIYKIGSITFIVFISIVILARLLFNIYFSNYFFEAFYWLFLKYILPFIVITNVLIYRKKDDFNFIFFGQLFIGIFILVVGFNTVYDLYNMDICSNYPLKIYQKNENIKSKIFIQTTSGCGPFEYDNPNRLVYRNDVHFDFFGTNYIIDTNDLDLSQWEKVKYNSH